MSIPKFTLISIPQVLIVHNRYSVHPNALFDHISTVKPAVCFLCPLTTTFCPSPQSCPRLGLPFAIRTLVSNLAHLFLGFRIQKVILPNVKETWKLGEKASVKHTAQQPGVRSKGSVVFSIAISVIDKHNTF